MRKVLWTGMYRTHTPYTAPYPCRLVEVNGTMCQEIKWDGEDKPASMYPYREFIDDALLGHLVGDPFPEVVKIQLAIEEIRR